MDFVKGYSTSTATTPHEAWNRGLHDRLNAIQPFIIMYVVFVLGKQQVSGVVGTVLDASPRLQNLGYAVVDGAPLGLVTACQALILTSSVKCGPADFSADYQIVSGVLMALLGSALGVQFVLPAVAGASGLTMKLAGDAARFFEENAKLI
jgi:hypothetical protein